MPDLTVESYWICETARSWSTRVGDHTVCWGFRHGGPVQYDYRCDCIGNARYRKTCRHIKEAKERHCNWQQFVDGGDVTAEKRCPRCGGPVSAERYGV